ncbi:norsolorinic acid reductase, putative [Talaromyces stipitatus ATCC 10500]|uniref:Norsolorinic acid reductase, putative n=1 Tax=Talaromyces stipitatus (strain ATCC 10500 / CBS 375.48 / QM 6759 / NRRL 1006) TaxID=441959 RepID=B8M7P4_TALSN|nr:norsolorinic acid reductase, putative [Talaromyces stipitatus ATCC 10500]EED19597.1 norsolorinic acid reductase, putative [Talaromyces stipitatus ATCC 10500]
MKQQQPSGQASKSLDATKVEYVRLGSSGLRVSRPMGAMGMSLTGTSPYANWLLNKEESLKVLQAAYDNGIDTWDTLNVVIMTKCGFVVEENDTNLGHGFPDLLAKNKDYVNHGGLSRTAILKSVDASLARLGTTYIDLLRFDYITTLEETTRALHDVVQAGKVRYIGTSSITLVAPILWEDWLVDKPARSKGPAAHEQVALEWHKNKDTVLIVGLNSVERVEETAGLREKQLTDDEKYQPSPASFVRA